MVKKSRRTLNTPPIVSQRCLHSKIYADSAWYGWRTVSDVSDTNTVSKSCQNGVALNDKTHY